MSLQSGSRASGGEVMDMTDNTALWTPVAATVRAALAQRVRHQTQPPGSGLAGWRRRWDESVFAVAGVTGSVGTTTVGLALASAAALTRPARLVECATPARSGLVAAAGTELGAGRGGWMRGERGGLMLIRRTDTSLFEAPPPPPQEDGTLTVLDLGELLVDRPPQQSVDADAVNDWIVVVRASVPCLRRLELALDLSPARNPVLAIVGPPPRRWPRQLASAAQPRTRELIETGRVVTFRHDRRLALAGLTPAALPPHIAASGRRLLLLLEGVPQ